MAISRLPILIVPVVYCNVQGATWIMARIRLQAQVRNLRLSKKLGVPVCLPFVVCHEITGKD